MAPLPIFSTSEFAGVTQSPKAEDYVPLTDYQSHTPASFGGTPVLYYHVANTKLVIARDSQASHPEVGDFLVAVKENSVAFDNDNLVIESVDVWVTSGTLVLFSHAVSKGISIPYPDICLHAIQRLNVPTIGPSGVSSQGLYMQLSLDEGNGSDEDIETLDLTVVPSATVTSNDPQPVPIQGLFDAIAACSDLHPDEASDHGEFDVGSSDDLANNQWVTADNIHEFTDADGNFSGFSRLMEPPGGRSNGAGTGPDVVLGPGAGTVHGRENGGDNGEHMNGGPDPDGVNGDTKWQRTE